MGWRDMRSKVGVDERDKDLAKLVSETDIVVAEG